MIIRIYGKNYKIKKNMANSARVTIRKLLEKVRMESELKGMEEYYVAFVVMMYVTSSSILRETNLKSIEDIVEAMKKESDVFTLSEDIDPFGDD